MCLLWERCGQDGFGALVITGTGASTGGEQVGSDRASWERTQPSLALLGPGDPLGLVCGRSHKRGFCQKNVIRDLAGHLQEAQDSRGQVLALSCSVPAGQAAGKVPGTGAGGRGEGVPRGGTGVSPGKGLEPEVSPGTGLEPGVSMGTGLEPGVLPALGFPSPGRIPRLLQKRGQCNTDQPDGAVGNVGQSRAGGWGGLGRAGKGTMVSRPSRGKAQI